MKKYLALKASAGSGKTFALTVRYISLLLLGAKPKEILTLTFTNKAANEMSERIYKTLIHLGDDEAYLKAITQTSGVSKDKILQKKEKLVKEFSQGNLCIFTIDTFINRVLRQFCGYVGIDDDFEIKEDDTEKLSSRFLHSLDINSYDKLIDFSLFEQKKYNSLFEIFKNIYEKNEMIDIANIDFNLILLQKDKALKPSLKIKEFILNCPVASNSAKKAVDFQNFDELILKTWVSKNSAGEYAYFKKCTNELLEEYFSTLKDELSKYYKLKSIFNLSRLFELYKLFKNHKLSYNKEKNHLHFNDVLNITYELLSSKIDKEFLYFRLDSNFSHILIDEFQDTSLLQYKILQELIEELISSDEFKTFFYVGDTKQSIYRFRGGKRELFDYVIRTNKQIKVEVLNTNYRSCKQIVDFVNNSFNEIANYEYYEQKAIYKNGYVEVFEDEFLQEKKYENIAKKISNLMQQGVNSNDIAILTYTNEDVLNLYSYLKKMFTNLKISTEMTSKLINQENVKAVINGIKFLYFNEEIYKENLNAIIGKAPLSKLNLEINIKVKSVQEIIFHVANLLDLMDDNVARLIELSSSYKNIVDFVYEIDKLDASIENFEQTGLQILTIFKAKGLEFHTVLILDRIKNQKNQKGSSLLFEYEDIHLKNIYYKITNLENYSQEYKEALQKEKKLLFEDELNILYVALTRAKKNMIIFKKSEKSVFDALDLKVCSFGKIIKSENKTKNYEKTQKIIYAPLNLGLQDKPISKQEDEKTYTLHGKYFGIATHYCLEMMGNFTLNSLKYSINLSKNRYSNYLEEKDFDDIFKRVLMLIENKEFQSLISNSILSKEQSLIYKNELKIIDLLAYKNKSYYIFDYKTSKDELQEHVFQISNYENAIKTIFDTQNVSSFIIYLKSSGLKIKKI